MNTGFKQVIAICFYAQWLMSVFEYFLFRINYISDFWKILNISMILKEKTIFKNY